VTQVGQEQLPVGQASSPAAPVRSAPGMRVRIEAGTLMQKLVPPGLVEPYLTGQRSVLTGFVHPAGDGVPPHPAWLQGPGAGPAAPDPRQDTADVWVLRWRALDIQTYLAASPAAPAAGLFLAPGPVPVGAEMYRITLAGEEFIARHDGQSWLRPKPELRPGPGAEG
jgi:hypothetical protein